MKLAGSDTEHPLAAWADHWVSSVAYERDDGFNGRDDKNRYLPGVFSPTRMLYSPEDVEALRADRERTHELWEDSRPAPSRSFWRFHRLVVLSSHPETRGLGILVEVPLAVQASR